jgi:lipoprotein-anchoring transpeptidase ErfK/SrfK
MLTINKQKKPLGLKAWPVVLAVFLLFFTMMSAQAGAQEKPLAPCNPWACDRPDDTGGKINLGWSDSPTPEIAAYHVYRSQTSGGPYGYVGKHSTDAEVVDLAYVDTDLTDGVTYYYVVTAVDRQGRESDFSSEVSAIPAAQQAMAAVSIQKSMVISLADQRLYLMENGRVVNVFAVSSGAGDKATPTGNFRILYHDTVHPVPKYPGCVCNYWMGFFEDYAIHAWPTYNGAQGDYSGLGYPASHGCVRLDPTTAHIPFYWAPDGTPLSIIAGSFQTPALPVAGGDVARSVSEPSKTWYFAEGYTGGGFDEYILVFNPNNQATSVDFDFMRPDGSVYTQGFPVGANSRMTVHVDDVVGMGNTDVSVRLRCGLPVVAERSMYFDYNGKTGGHTAVGVTVPSQTWFFAEGYTGGGFDEYILVQNPNNQATSVDFDFMRPDGSVYTQGFPVGANTRMTVHVDDVQGMDNTDVSVRLRSGLPVVAERAMYFGYNGIDGGHVSTGTSEPSAIWYFAEGYTGGGFSEYILVQNPNDQATNVDFDFMRPDGSVYTQGFQIGANTRMTVSVDGIQGMDNTDVSVRLRSGLPVVAERAMYFGYQDCPGGSVNTGCAKPSTTHYLAEGYTSNFFDTYLLIMNAEDTSTIANVTFYLPSGQQIGWSTQVAAHSRYSVQVNLIPNLSSTEFSIKVETKTPVVVERAMYYNFPR